MTRLAEGLLFVNVIITINGMKSYREAPWEYTELTVEAFVLWPAPHFLKAPREKVASLLNTYFNPNVGHSHHA